MKRGGIKLLLGLFFGMVSLGILYAWFFHLISMPLFNNILIHCIILGGSFGLLNFLLASWYIRRHSHLKKHNERLRSKLFTDSLTGLLNRRAYDLELDRLDVPIYSVLFIDIDNFRIFNNQYGHKIGDDVLQKVSEIVKSVIRLGDRAFRYGGEEIVVLLKECDKESAQRVAEKIRTQVFLIDDNPYPPITISIGVASFPNDGKSIQDIIEKSDSALLLAKEFGKNRTVCASKD